jgi:hypothetical protein
MITKSELKELLNYDKDTGIFTWKKRTSNRLKVGSVAGNNNNSGYIELKVTGIRFLAHRLAWLYEHGELPKLIDHINGNRSDNRICNLRPASYAENVYNSKIRSDNKSGVRCVSWNNRSNKWEVRIKLNGKLRNFGSYKDLTLATIVADKIRQEHHNEFYR